MRRYTALWNIAFFVIGELQISFHLEVIVYMSGFTRMCLVIEFWQFVNES